MSVLGAFLITMAAGCAIALAIIIGDLCYRANIRKRWKKIKGYSINETYGSTSKLQNR